MRSKKVEFRMQHELYDRMHDHAMKTGFKNDGAYLTALVMQNLSHEQRMEWLRAIANSNKRTLQDLVFRQLLILGVKPEEIVCFARTLETKRKQRKP